MLRALLLALSLLVFAAAGAPAASVTIAPSGGGVERSLTLTDFDVHGVTYTVRAADGTDSTTTVAEGISLRALLAAAGLDGDAFDYIALEKADGTSAIVMRDDLGSTDEGPPVVWSDAQGTHFLRPSSGEGDANGADLVTLADGAPLMIALKRGQPLVPRIAVSPRRPRPGERVGFGASLAGGGSLGPGLEFQWYFDGPRVYGANVSHRFAKPGRYHVLLNVVRGDRTSVGDPAVLDVRVARPRERHADEAHPAADAGGGRSGGGAGATIDGGAGIGTPAAASPAPRAVTPAAAAPQPAPATPGTPPGKLVSGTLLASASAAAAPRPASGRAASAAVRRAAADGPLHVPVGVWAAVGLVGLLALGWALESRHTLPFWQP